MLELDIEKIRGDTPACERIMHFNNAGASLSPAQVTKAVIDHLQLEQEVGGYEAARLADAEISGFYDNFSRLLNCDPKEIAYVENSTRAWDMALHAIDWRPGDKILTFQNEYASNYLALLHLAKLKSVELIVVPTDDSGLVNLQALNDTMNSQVKLVCLTHVASHHGIIQPAQQIGNIAHQHGALFLLDACQSVGQMALDTKRIACDFLCGSGRKYLRAPRGTGFLYVAQDILEQLNPVFIDLHSANWLDENIYELSQDASRFENWERYIAGQIGLSSAVSYALNLSLEKIESRVQALAKKLVAALSEISDVTVYEKSDQQLSGIVTFNKTGKSATELQQRLSSKDINVSVSKTASARLDFGRRGINDVVRASVHYYNTEAEIDRFVAFLRS